MEEIVDIKAAEKKRYEEIQKRIEELEGILGFRRDETGSSLSRRSRSDPFAAKLFERIQEKYQDEREELLHLDAEASRLEDALGITDEIMKMIEEMDFPDSDIDIYAK